jgi:serine/threonine protein kinase
MTVARAPRFKIGTKITRDLTVLGAIRTRGRYPVYIVWHHADWAPMACKVFGKLSRAKREANIMAALSHPNIVRFLGVVEPALLLMEFLEGPTLGSVIDDMPRERMSISNSIRVAIHLGAALHHIHRKGFIHLDIKPTNVIVVRGRPVLYDFGSARKQGAPRPPHVAGTDAYIAPEECLRGDVTPASDVFGLGVTLYEMLTGDLPFPRKTPRNPFPQATASPVRLRQRRKDIPAGLDELVMACLAREPAERPAIPALLPLLHDFIRTGPPMWPAHFRPLPNRRPA